VGLWAGVESCIDRLNHAGWVLSRGSLSKRLPRNFSDKVSLYRKVPTLVPELSEFGDAAGTLTDRVLAGIDDRHFLVHGYTLIDDRRNGDVVLRKHRFTGASIEDEDRSYSLMRLRELNEIALQLSSDWADHVRTIAAKVANIEL
jgi:hypothetical protein